LARTGCRRRTVPLLVLVLVLAGFLWNFHRVARLFFPVAYGATITTYAAENNLDPRLVAALIKIESGFRPGASSPKGALGLMQVMPDTGRWAAAQLGLTGFTPDSLYDPATNIRIGCWYLAQLQRMFGGRPVLVLIAYNAGDHKARDWFPGPAAGQGDTALITRIPYQETRLFVQKVLLAYTFYQRLYDRNLQPK